MAADPDPEQLPPSLVERFEVLGTLGQGGMGVVLRVRRRADGEVLALKRSLQPLKGPLAQRFAREVEALARVRHPHVLRLVEHGVADEGLPYLVTELLEGTSMHALPPGTPVHEPLRDVARGLDALHREGLLHRDLKPANFFRTRDGRGVLIDLGLAKDPDRTALTATGTALGTLPYMAPEVLDGDEASPASDWYAWGVSLYALRLGRLPFTVAHLMTALGRGTWTLPDFAPLPPDGPAATLLRDLLTEDPARRLTDLATIEARLAADRSGSTDDPDQTGWTVADLSGLEAALPTPTPPRRQPRPRAAPPRRAPLGPRVALASLLALGGAAFMLGASPSAPAPTPPPTPSDSTPSGPSPSLDDALAALERQVERLVELCQFIEPPGEKARLWTQVQERRRHATAPDLDQGLEALAPILVDVLARMAADPPARPAWVRLHKLVARLEMVVFRPLWNLSQDLQDLGFLARFGGQDVDPETFSHGSRAATVEHLLARHHKVARALAGLPASDPAMFVRVYLTESLFPPDPHPDLPALEARLRAPEVPAAGATTRPLPPHARAQLLRARLVRAARWARESRQGRDDLARIGQQVLDELDRDPPRLAAPDRLALGIECAQLVQRRAQRDPQPNLTRVAAELGKRVTLEPDPPGP